MARKQLTLTPEEEKLILKNREKMEKREVALGVTSLEDLYKKGIPNLAQTSDIDLESFLLQSNSLIEYANKYLKKDSPKKYHKNLTKRLLASGWDPFSSINSESEEIKNPLLFFTQHPRGDGSIVVQRDWNGYKKYHRFNIPDIGYITLGMCNYRPVLHYLNTIPSSTYRKTILFSDVEVEIYVVVCGSIVKYEASMWGLRRLVDDNNSIKWSSPIRENMSSLRPGPVLYNKLLTDKEIKKWLYKVLEKHGVDSLAECKQYLQDVKTFMKNIKNLRQQELSHKTQKGGE